MGQPSEEWAFGGAIGPRTPTGPSLDPFPHSSLPVDPVPNVPWGEIANPALTSLSILLPALNEEDGVAAVLNPATPQILPEQGDNQRHQPPNGRATVTNPPGAKRAEDRIIA